MIFKSIVVLYICTRLCHGKQRKVIYDRYDGLPATQSQLDFYKSVNQLGNCTINITLPCNKNEWRRMDGSCTNLNFPSRGTYLNPMPRILPAVLHNGGPRLAKNGNPLEPARDCRLKHLKVANSDHPDLTILTTYLLIFAFIDTGSVHDLRNNAVGHPNCCARKNDNMCANIYLKNDPVHGNDGITCLNLTRPLVYQDYNCTKDKDPSPLAEVTQSYDLSQTYKPSDMDDKEFRTGIGGRLKVFEVDGIQLPPNGTSKNCPMNQENETYCFKEKLLNGFVPAQLYTIWFFKNHNIMADKMAKLNPHWDDETLYQSARDVNIAIYLQIYMYELFEVLIGSKYLRESGLHYGDLGHNDRYDESVLPEVTLENTYFIRWFHTNQKGVGLKYDAKGNIVGTYRTPNTGFRTGRLLIDNNLETITRGCYTQPAKDYDYTVDYDMAERGLGDIQKVVDTFSNDLVKGRLFGIAPYVDYVYKFYGINITCFDDLVTYGLIPKERLPIVKSSYDDPSDMDALAILWNECAVDGGRIPKTLAYTMVKDMLTAVKSDRHWYERPNRPHAFTEAQLAEVRKMTMSRLLCDCGEGVTEVQPNSFLRISSENPLKSCSEIPEMDFSVWKEV